MKSYIFGALGLLLDREEHLCRTTSKSHKIDILTCKCNNGGVDEF